MTAPPFFGTIQIPGMRILSEIGRGAHSIVYRATRGDQTFAVKVRDETVSNHAIDVLPRFRREAAVLACLRHPGLPTIVEAGEVAGQPYLVMEYVDGRTLSEQLEDGPLAEARIVGLAMVLAGALAEVHRYGLVHRDVKPENVLLDSAGGVRLIDFGFAALIPTLHCHYLALAAAYERLRGRSGRALTLLARAAITARDADSPWALYVGRDAGGHDLSELTGYSSTVVERARVERQPLVVSGSEQGVALGSESIVARDLRSILAAPLLLHDRLIGVVYLDNRLARGIFTSDDVDILLSLAQYIPIALEAARTARLEIRYQSERQRRKLEETLRVVTSALNSTLDLSEVLDRLLKSMAQIVPYDGAVVILRQGERFDVMAARELAGAGVRPDRDERFAEIARTRQPLLIGDSANDPRLGASGDGARIQSWLGVPLISRGEVVGILTLESHTAGAYNQRAAEVAFTFAGQAAIAIENARLFGEVQRLATTDGLTGTYNRRHFFIVAEHEVQRARRTRHSMGVIMLDVDHFKRVNDSHGHAAGDQVLRSIAERCQQNIRAVDSLGRYGGEEFAILLPEADMAVALVVAERLRQCVASAPVLADGHAISVTLSLGVAVLANEGDDLEAVFYRADAALYAAKQAGRNRVVLGGT